MHDNKGIWQDTDTIGLPGRLVRRNALLASHIQLAIQADYQRSISEEYGSETCLDTDRACPQTLTPVSQILFVHAGAFTAREKHPRLRFKHYRSNVTILHRNGIIRSHLDNSLQTKCDVILTLTFGIGGMNNLPPHMGEDNRDASKFNNHVSDKLLTLGRRGNCFFVIRRCADNDERLVFITGQGLPHKNKEKSMKGINRTLTAGMVAGLVTLAPTLAMASGDLSSSNTGFHALSTLQQSDLITLDAMSENELGNIQGESFNFGFNFAFAPQINICVLCNGVNQYNIASISGYNIFR